MHHDNQRAHCDNQCAHCDTVDINGEQMVSESGHPIKLLSLFLCILRKKLLMFPNVNL